MLQQVIHEIQDEVLAQETYYKNAGKYIEAQRISERVNYDLEMIRELAIAMALETTHAF